jgi:hypothetical protein
VSLDRQPAYASGIFQADQRAGLFDDAGEHAFILAVCVRGAVRFHGSASAYYTHIDLSKDKSRFAKDESSFVWVPVHIKKSPWRIGE